MFQAFSKRTYIKIVISGCLLKNGSGRVCSVTQHYMYIMYDLITSLNSGSQPFSAHDIFGICLFSPARIRIENKICNKNYIYSLLLQGY
jgi:hypothetical protein